MLEESLWPGYRDLNHTDQHSPTLLKKVLFIDWFMAILGLHCCAGFSLAVAGGGSSLLMVCWLLIPMASLVAEQGSRAQRLCSCGAWA